MPLEIVTRSLVAAGFALSLGACGSDSGSPSSPPPAPTAPAPRPLRRSRPPNRPGYA